MGIGLYERERKRAKERNVLWRKENFKVGRLIYSFFVEQQKRHTEDVIRWLFRLINMILFVVKS